MKKLFWILVIALSFFMISGCWNISTNTETMPNEEANVWWIVDHTDLSGAIDDVLLAIKNNDLLILSTFVWTQGLRFSPYTYINTGSDIILSTEEIYNWLAMSNIRNRWAYDGTGFPIELWIGQYFEKFVNNADYANAPEIIYNQVSERGNNMNNIAEVYEGKQRVEFYFPWFDPEFVGLDWKSLTLVFDQVDGNWELVGIIHNQWTI